MGERHRIRATWHDYGGGVYFVTICSYDKKRIFGYIDNNEMHLNEHGSIVKNCIAEISIHNSDTEIWNYVIMPNHIHMIIAVGTRYIASAACGHDSVTSPIARLGCLKQSMHGEICNDFHHNSRLAAIIGSFKAAVTRTANRQTGTGRGGRDISRPYWQSRYHEHIIRNQRSFNNIMAYIDSNVERWHTDCFNTENDL